MATVSGGLGGDVSKQLPESKTQEPKLKSEGWWLSDGHSSVIKLLAAQARGPEEIPSNYQLFNSLYHCLVRYASVYFQLRMIPKQIVLYPTLDTQHTKAV